MKAMNHTLEEGGSVSAAPAREVVVQLRPGSNERWTALSTLEFSAAMLKTAAVMAVLTCLVILFTTSLQVGLSMLAVVATLCWLSGDGSMPSWALSRPETANQSDSFEQSLAA